MSRLVLIFISIWVSVNLTGRAAAVVAGSGYLAVDDEAAESVGDFLGDVFSRKVSSTERTRKALNYKDSQGLVVRLLDQSVRPKQVLPGKPITVTVEYAVLGALTVPGKTASRLPYRRRQSREAMPLGSL